MYVKKINVTPAASHASNPTTGTALSKPLAAGDERGRRGCASVVREPLATQLWNGGTEQK